MAHLKGKRVLVTGGAGFIASHIVDLLVREGCGKIIIIDNMMRGRRDNLRAAMAHDSVRLLEGDIRDPQLMDEVVRHSDIVFHQAALRITQCAEEPGAALEVMVDATFTLLQLCVKYKVEKVVVASSASVYGMASQFPTPESHHVYNNRTLYGAAKTFNEGLLRSFHEMYGLNYVALRYFNVYGPRMDMHGVYTEVLIRWMERIGAGDPPLIFGPGDQTMDLIHVRDVARANVLAATTNVTDEVFNVASGTETSLNQLADILLAAMGSVIRPEHRPQRSVNPVQRRLADVTRARQMLGFTASVPLNEGVREFVAWWQEERAGQTMHRLAEPCPEVL